MNLPHVSEPDFVVLHTIRCIGYASGERITTAAGVGTQDGLDTLRSLSDQGLVARHDGPFGGWSLTDEGRARDSEWVTAELAVSGTRERVRESYLDFLALNPRLLAVCSAWQFREVGGLHLTNDHRDPDYDFGVIDRLADIDRSVQAILETLASQLARFSTYRRRLQSALERVDAGDHGYFTDGLESYHTVWFQLHEDLLSTLGLERGTEP